MQKDIGLDVGLRIRLLVDTCYRATANQYIMAIIGAVFIASAIVCLKSVDLLDKVKANTLNVIASAYSPDFSHDVATENKATLRNTFKLIIDQPLYETAFNQSAPLDRRLIASLIDELGKANITLLAIDIDLSPNPKVTTSDDKLLQSALKNLADLGTKIVLIVPEPVVTKIAIEQKKSWMDSLANYENIWFGLGSIYTQDGIALKYLDSCSGFARTIHDVIEYEMPCRNLNRDYSSLEKNVLLPPINDALPGQDKKSLLLNRAWRSALNEYSVVKGKLRHLNWRFAAFPPENNIKPYVSKVQEQATLALHGSDQARLNHQVVFLGGDYGLTDYYVTPAGKMPGVDVHVGAYYTSYNTINNRDYWWPFVIEIFLGFFLSIMVRQARAFHSLNPHIMLRAIYLVGVVFILFLLGFFAYRLLVGSNIWINPAPLFLGILWHDLISYITGEEEVEEQSLDNAVTSQNGSFYAVFSRKSAYQKTNTICTIAVYFLVIGYAFLYLSSHT